MQAIAVWEDDENNRRVSLSVDADKEISLENITPVRIEFPAQSRSIGVHTEAARNVIRRQIQESGQLEKVIAAVEESLLVSQN